MLLGEQLVKPVVFGQYISVNKQFALKSLVITKMWLIFYYQKNNRKEQCPHGTKFKKQFISIHKLPQNIIDFKMLSSMSTAACCLHGKK